MKTKLLFTAALMSALSAVPSDMYAFQFRGNEFSARDYVSVLAEDVKERPEDGTDVSEWIVNSDFNNNNGDGWENGNVLGFAGSSGVLCGTAEVFDREFQISQLIENIPNGLYTVTVQGWANRGNRAYLNGSTYVDKGSSVIGDGISGSLQDVSKTFNENLEAHKVVLGNLMVVDGKIRIGVSWNGYYQKSWVAFDNFKLIYNNDGKDRISGLYNDLKNKLQTLADDNQYPEVLRDKVNSALSSVNPEDNTDSYCSAYMQLKDQNLESLFSSEAKELKKMQDLCQKLITDNDGDVSSLKAALEQSNSELSSVKNNDEIILIYNNLKASCNNYLANIGGTCIESYDFNDGKWDGWNKTGNAWPSFADEVLEFYNTNFDFWRPLSGLNKGWYQIEVNAFYRSTDYASYLDKKNKTLAVVFGDNGGPDKRYSMPALCLYEQNCEDLGGMSNEGKFPNWRSEANKCFSAGRYKMVVNAYVGDNGTLNYGLAGTNQGNSWMCFDNFKVTYMGSDLVKMYDAMKSDAIALAEKYGLTAYKAEIEDMAPQDTENVTENDVWTLNEKTKKIIDIVNKIVDVKLGNNAEAQNILTKKDELLSNSTAPQSSLDKFNKICDIENTDYIYSLVSSEEDVDHIFKNAYYDYLNEADPVGDYTFDMNHLLTNPDLTNFPSWSQQAGWYTDTDKKIQCMHNSQVALEEGKDAFYEIYAGSRTPMPEGNILYQKTVLAPGSYQMTACAFGLGVNDNYTGNISGNFFAGETKGDAVTAVKLTQGSVKFVQSNEQEIKLGLYSDGTGAANWAGIGYMKLYKVAPDALLLSEGNSTLGINSDTYGNVTVERSLKADGKWNTFCVPFAMTAEQLAANKIEEVRKLENTVENGGSVVLNFSDPVTEIEAGVPYIVKVSDAVSQITVNGVAVKVAEPAPLEVGSVNMLGNYGKINITGYDKYFISDNKFYRAADKNIIVKGFRAYITMDQAAAGVNQMLINIDGNVTAIEDVLGEDVDATVNVYTIDGVCVKSGVKSSEALDGLRKGIYIVNGKKVVK